MQKIRYRYIMAQNNRTVAWFTEGFTNYYANLTLLRAKLITVDEYIKRYNETLVAYYSSSARSATVKEVQEGFWKNHDIQLIPYQQGEIIAHNWNAKIKQESNNKKSLDDLMRALID